MRSEFDSEQSELDLKQIAATLLRRKWIIIGSLGLIGLVALITVLRMTPLYTAEALVLINVRESTVVDMEAVLSGLPPDSAVIDSEVEVLRSRGVAERVVKKLRLDRDKEFNPQLRAKTFGQYISPMPWIRSLLQLFQSEREISQEDAEANAFSSVVNAVLGRLSISRKRLTYVIEISFLSEDPKKAARIANSFADTYLLEQLEAKFEAVSQATNWLNDRLVVLRAKLRDSERAVEIYREENGLIDAGGMTLSEKELSELNARLVLIRIEKEGQRAKLGRVQQLLQSGNAEGFAEVLESQVVAVLRQQQAEIVRKAAELSSKYGPRHPEMIKVEAEQRDLEHQIGLEVQRIVAKLSSDLVVTRSQERALKDALTNLTSQNTENNKAFIQLRELEREATANQTVYETFLNRFKETSEQGGIQTSDARILSEAAVPVGSSKPKKLRILVLVEILALFLGVGVVFLLEHFDNGFHTGEEIEMALGLPHITSVPLLSQKEAGNSPQNYGVSHPLSMYAEAFRSLRLAVSLSNVDKPPQVILFTSAVPNEGKSVTALSFARAAALSGIKTIIIDCDMRRPSVHSFVNVSRPEAGLVEMLSNQVSLDDIIQKDPLTSLEFTSIAGSSINPSDLFSSNKMEQLIEACRSRYDLIVFDSPPVLPVIDALILARLADKTVFVVRWDKTAKQTAAEAIKRLKQADADIAGVVMELVDMKKSHQYYGYASEYGKYYHSYYVG